MVLLQFIAFDYARNCITCTTRFLQPKV